MDIFRLIGDLSHLLAIIILFLKIWKTRSCAGISGRSQILFALVFSTRYLDLFTHYISLYNTLMKIFYLVSSFGIVYLIYFKFKKTYDRNHDTFRVEFFLVSTAILALLINNEFDILEVIEIKKSDIQTFSIYLESIAILPQFYMIKKIGHADHMISYYLFAMAAYRYFYILNWIYRYYSEGFYDLIAILGGIVQTVLYFDFFYHNNICFVNLEPEKDKEVEVEVKKDNEKEVVVEMEETARDG